MRRRLVASLGLIAALLLTSCREPEYTTVDNLLVNLDDSKQHLSIIDEADFERQMRMLTLTSPFEEAWQITVRDGKVHAYEMGVSSYICRTPDGLETGVTGNAQASVGVPTHFHPDQELLWRYVQALPETTCPEAEGVDGPDIKLSLDEWVENWGPSIQQSFKTANKETNFADVYALLYNALTIDEDSLLEYNPYGKKTIELTTEGREYLARYKSISLAPPERSADLTTGRADYPVELRNEHLRIAFTPYEQGNISFRWEHRESIKRLREENYKQWVGQNSSSDLLKQAGKHE